MSTGLRAGTNNDGYLQVNGTDVLTALSSGRIGIGITNPGAKLVVSGTNGSLTAYTIQTASSSIINPNNSGSEIIGAQISLGGNIVVSERQPNTAYSDRTDLAIVTDTGYGLGKSEKIRIISNGDVELNQHYSSAPTNAGRDSPTVTFKGHGHNTSSGSVEVGTRLISTHNYWTGSYSNTFGQTYPDFKILIKNSDSASYVEKFVFQGNGVLRISQSGGGIDFSANPNAAGTTNELFNDYEVGTFTPTLVGHSGAGTVATGTVSGTYTKIGNTVIYHVAWSNITYSVKPAGIVKISGLAFATLNGRVTGYVSQEGIDVGFTKAYGTNGGDIVLREYGSNVDVAFRVATSTGWDNYMEGGSTTFGVTGGTSWYGIATIIQTAST